MLQGVEQREAIFAHRLGIRRTLGLLLGQPAVFDAFAVSFVPGEGGHALQPRRSDSRSFIEGCPQGLGHQCEAMQHTDGREHVGRVGALLASGFESSHRPTPLQQRLQEALGRLSGAQPVTNLAAHGKVEAGVHQL